jgi:hypothetical protein
VRYRRLYEQERGRSGESEGQLRREKEEREGLERELMAVRERFADTVSEIESAKERERSLYEESIVRLLGNMDRREGKEQFSTYSTYSRKV